MLIDTHLHLDAAEYAADAAGVLARARAAGVRGFVVPAVAPSNFAAVRALAQTEPDVVAAFGVHPLYVDGAGEQPVFAVSEALAAGEAVAVGEIGLDHYVAGLDRTRMAALYGAQLEMARRAGLPVLLHVRRAQDEILHALRRTRVPGGIAHAFNGSLQQAQAFIGLGFKLGFGGAMTYEGSRRIRALAASLPLESLVLETDGPDIPPAWRPQGPSLPEELMRYAQVLADLRGLPLDAVIAATGANALAVLPGLAKKIRR